MECRAHANPYPDYSNNPTLFIKDGKVCPSLTDKTDHMVKNLTRELSDVLKGSTCHSEYSVYTGYCGIAMFIMRAAVDSSDNELMSIALEKCEMACENLKKKRACFLNGDAGPLALCAIIKHLCNDKQSSENYVKRLVKLNYMIEDKDMPDEMLYGRAGYLHALLIVNRYMGPEMISPIIIRKIAERILQSGKCLSKCRKSCVPLEYEWHDKNYLGAAHGTAGILYTLLEAYKILTEYELKELIQPTIDWLLKNYQFPSGNFASSEGSGKDRLVQWCHGAPGFTHLLLKGYQVFKDDKYMKAAIDCGEVIWQRGLTTKGYSLCHGVTGNAYSFLKLYKATKDIKYWHRAACFADWCTKYPTNQGLQPDRPFSLFEGKAGMAYYLLEYKDPSESGFPAYEV